MKYFISIIIFLLLSTSICFSQSFQYNSNNSATSSKNSKYNGSETNFRNNSKSSSSGSYKNSMSKNYETEYYSNDGRVIERGDFYRKPKGPYNSSIYSDDNIDLNYDRKQIIIK